MKDPVWLQFQREILDTLTIGDQFTAHDVAGWTGVSREDASAWIQCYLGAQRGRRAATKYVLSRTGRTRAAVWTVGRRTEDARNIVGQFGADIGCTIRRAVEPDLTRIGMVNPRARVAVEASLDPMISGLVGVIDGIMKSVGWDG